MADSSAEGFTQLLAMAVQGDDAALCELADRVDDDLRRIARRQFAREPDGHTLQPTAIVNEAWIGLINTDGKLAIQQHANRAQFFATAARVMRHILVNYARRRRAKKRGGDQVRMTFDDRDRAVETEDIDVLAVHKALEELEAQWPRAARVVELRYFSGVTINVAADALEVSPETVKNDWRFAKAWLRRKLANDE